MTTAVFLKFPFVFMNSIYLRQQSDYSLSNATLSNTNANGYIATTNKRSPRPNTGRQYFTPSSG